MPISLDTLRTASKRQNAERITQSFVTVQAPLTAFLCHSHNDADLVKGLLNLFHDEGWRIYVDWNDAAMPETPTHQTAKRIQQKIKLFDYFLFLATPNSLSSRWCPWEIGYADGVKPTTNILVIPTEDRSGTWYGSEYLQLYSKITIADGNVLGVFEPNQTNGVRLYSLR